ncbi:FcoT family thioesterase [Actinomadura sp. KC06]|uniref:FcoT family thioesterase n=1 Tax=Actinomadura sp. KC06 TaxID=2530369 RepID=UPI001FB70373|nr:FcoT family thioesterase [Actinomadura sp. KC06]
MAEVMDRPGRVTDPVRHANDPELLTRVLRPYRAKNCEYLTSAEITVAGDPAEQGRLGAACTFEIPESCYIDDTGHFNAVEFNICFNQMFYYLVAKSVKERLTAPFSRWSMDDFWTRQLGEILITDFRSAFRTQMRGRHFHGEIDLVDVAEWDGSDIRDALVVIRTTCRYWDEHGGDSHGEVTAAILNPPPSGG